MRQRDRISGNLDLELIGRRQREGWRLVGLEWERDEPGERPQTAVDPPFGFQVAGDCSHLEEHPSESEILRTIMRGVVNDRPLSQIAEELNTRGFRTRGGETWSPARVFRLMPELVDNGPRIFSSPEWPALRQANVPV
jgi:hypothetical protein